MWKEKVWKIGSAVLLILLTCTVLSGRIQEMMYIRVWTVTGELRQEEEIQIAALPKTCIHDEDGPVVYYLTQEEGIFHSEWKVAVKHVGVYDETEAEVLILAEDMKDASGRYLNVIAYSAYPVEEGDVVVREEQ